jgi:hypothetical protein
MRSQLSPEHELSRARDQSYVRLPGSHLGMGIGAIGQVQVDLRIDDDFGELDLSLLGCGPDRAFGAGRPAGGK